MTKKDQAALDVGEEQIENGIEALEDAQDIAALAAAELASGASNPTRAADLEFVAERVATLSQVVGTAGAADVTRDIAREGIANVAEGAALIGAVEMVEELAKESKADDDETDR